LPIIVGGGLDSVIKVKQVINSGANMLVIGNALEKNVFLLTKISKCF
jgi:putative glycerol-1-phosphate prenyltransferase